MSEELKKYYAGSSFLGSHIYGSFIKDQGVLFRLIAPGATKVYVLGSFNNYQKTDELTRIDDFTFEIFLKKAKQNDYYKYLICDGYGNEQEKIDPFAKYYEKRPGFCSIITKSLFNYTDSLWMQTRSKNFQKPLNIYEIHLGAWKRIKGGVSYRNIAPKLIDYLKKMHYTHVEFMPLTEYPFDGSWGYQAYGYFAPTSRYGHLDDLKYLINELHRANIGVILDFVLVHFVKDNYALVNYDYEHLYEYKDQEKAHSEWDTYNFDFSSNLVKSFLLSSVYYFLNEFHFDGLRFDAISNLLYYLGNKDKGVNYEALDFIKELTNMVNNRFSKQVMLIAEDSTDYPKVTKPIEAGGLGFDYKWCLGWMNDTLKYFTMDPLSRINNHHLLTFSIAYYNSENFLLPLSHDEVVHGKRSIVSKMYGLYGERFASARALYAYMYMHPGHKLNFMGNEIGQIIEFDEKREIDWLLLDYEMHQKFQYFHEELNKLYLQNSCLYKHNYDENTFFWINADKKSDSMYMFIRYYKTNELVFILNMSQNYYENYRVGVRKNGNYLEVINTDNLAYGGYGVYNGMISSDNIYQDNLENSITLKIAPFSAIILKLVDE